MDHRAKTDLKYLKSYDYFCVTVVLDSSLCPAPRLEWSTPYVGETHMSIRNLCFKHMHQYI